MNRHTGVFIIGSPRSGTTLLQSIVASHSEYFSPPETSFFFRVIPLLGVRYSDPDCPVDEDAIAIIRQDFETMTGIEGFELRAGLTAREVFESLVNAFNDGSKPKWVEKTTNHAQTMLAIARYYPEAKFLHIIRDPIDSVASMVSIRPNSLGDFRLSYFPSIRGHAKLWNGCISSAFAYPRQENVLHLFYEDLIRKPEATIDGVCGFLGIGFEAGMMDLFHRSADALFSKQSCPWQNNNLVPGFHGDSVHKWRGKIPMQDVWLIQKYTEYWARYLGYYEFVTVPAYLKALCTAKDIGKWYLLRLEKIFRGILLRVKT